MSKDEAIKILDRYKDWNEGQTSVSLAMNNIRTKEDDIYDSRRELILTAQNTLKEKS